MSGHSKWATTKHKKNTIDQKRGILFTKLANNITVAARSGGDINTNFNLRLAVERAKQASVPKENIDRAIQRGTGAGEGVHLEEVTYEGLLSLPSPTGSTQVAIILECLTDNTNRTVNELKHLFSDHAGSLAGPGAVVWMFEKKAVIAINKQEILNNDLETLELHLIDLGASDLESKEDEILIYSPVENLKRLKEALEKENIKIESAALEYVAKEKIDLLDEQGVKVQNFFTILDENQDIINYYTNLK